LYAVAATAIAGLAVIYPVLTGNPFYSCYAGLFSRLTREGMSPGALCLLAEKTRIWADKLVSMNDDPEKLASRIPLVAFITSAISGLLLTWQGFLEGFATCEFLWAFRRQAPVFCGLSAFDHRNTNGINRFIGGCYPLLKG
jgi:hypothetical protein